MNVIAKSLLSALLISTCTSLPALADGELTIEFENGDVDSYEDVQIFHTPEMVYFKPEDGNTTLEITKNECQNEDEIIFCPQAQAGLNTNGVIEEIEVAQIALLINPSNDRQRVKGSKLTMGANTVLLEVATSQGTFITSLGKIDGTTSPEGGK